MYYDHYDEKLGRDFGSEDGSCRYSLFNNVNCVVRLVAMQSKTSSPAIQAEEGTVEVPKIQEVKEDGMELGEFEVAREECFGNLDYANVNDGPIMYVADHVDDESWSCSDSEESEEEDYDDNSVDAFLASQLKHCRIVKRKKQRGITTWEQMTELCDRKRDPAYKKKSHKNKKIKLNSVGQNSQSRLIKKSKSYVNISKKVKKHI